MKKYIKPIVKIVETETSSILAGSDPTLNNTQGNGSWHARDHRGSFSDGDED